MLMFCKKCCQNRCVFCPDKNTTGIPCLASNSSSHATYTPLSKMQVRNIVCFHKTLISLKQQCVLFKINVIRGKLERFKRILCGP